MDPGISVRLDEVGAVAAELSALAAELDDDALLCRSTATRLLDALGGAEGERAAAAGTAWAVLTGALAARVAALAATLGAAVGAYAAADAALAGVLGPFSGAPR